MKKQLLTGVGVAALLILGVIACISLGSDATYYYTQIDNTKVETIQSKNGGVVDPTGGMDYAYSLLAYDEQGAEKELTFGTKRQLKEGAFLRLEVLPIRGVIAWEEVQYNAMPTAVQEHYLSLDAKRE